MVYVSGGLTSFSRLNTCSTIRATDLLLNASKIKYDFNNVDALKGEHRKPQFLKIHPAGLLPAISEPQLGVIGKHVL